jgi:beta-barrel assembly-enhancing protease
MGIFNQGDQNPRQSSGLMGRIIVALAIAFIGWLMYTSQVQENPVTGEKQHVMISPDQEIRLGLEAAPQMSREMGGEVPSSDPRTQEVQRIGEILVMNTDAHKSPWKFQFHLLADAKTVNAFALPGGQVFITLGLFNNLQNEAQLAGVLGHEIGHVIERHTAEQMAKNQLGQMLVVAVGTAASDPSQGSGYSNPMVIASLVNQMFQLKYGRKDESEADVWGLKLMEQAGYDPTAMIAVMEVLKAASGGGHGTVPEIFQTHPNPDLRIEQIKAYLKEHPPKPGLKQGKSLKDLQQRRDVPGSSSPSTLEELFDLLNQGQ